MLLIIYSLLKIIKMCWCEVVAWDFFSHFKLSDPRFILRPKLPRLDNETPGQHNSHYETKINSHFSAETTYFGKVYCEKNLGYKWRFLASSLISNIINSRRH